MGFLGRVLGRKRTDKNNSNLLEHERRTGDELKFRKMYRSEVSSDRPREKPTLREKSGGKFVEICRVEDLWLWPPLPTKVSKTERLN